MFCVAAGASPAAERPGAAAPTQISASSALQILLIFRKPVPPDIDRLLPIGEAAVGVEAFRLSGVDAERLDGDRAHLRLRIAEGIDQFSVELHLLLLGEVDL